MSIAELVQELNELIAERDELRRRVEELEFVARNENRPKLTDRDARRIRELERAGYTQSDIASMFDVNKATVSRIVRGIYHC